ncbi:MAG: tetratricopeptide repeat protein [Cyanobacteria bacterium SZAS LIN-3]|nr:tetratricopeptide repeat protein [Cyanobacteria bacterium SZAS LIN-3]
MKNQNQKQLAIPYLTRAIALAPKEARLYEERGSLYCDLDEYARAITDCDRALALDKGRVEAYSTRGYCHDKLDNFDAAAKDYQTYINLTPPSCHENAGLSLANNLGQQGKVDEALKALDRVLAEFPKCGKARKVRGNFLNSDNRNPKQAIIDYTLAIDSKFDGYHEVYALRATAYTRTKEYAKAIADYTRVLALNTNDENVYRKRAAVYELMGDYKKAIQDYTSSIEKSPDWAGPSYFARARCYKKLGQPALAQKDLDECKKLDYDGK